MYRYSSYDGSNQTYDREYDGYISYDHHDFDFVQNGLINELETRANPPFRFCIHQRDFMVGVTITSNILNAVDASNLLIIILSQRYIESAWCLEELSLAHHEVSKDSSRRLIVIALQDRLILLQNCSPSIRNMRAFQVQSVNLGEKRVPH